MEKPIGNSLERWLFPVFLAAAAICLFIPAAFYPFANYDDPGFIEHNPLLGGFDWGNLVRIWSVGGVPDENLYIPLSYTTLFAETALFGKIPLPIHLDNILLHAVNAVLLFQFAKRLGLSASSAFLAALAFILHPLQIEPVAWCMGRKDVLSTALALGALLCFPPADATGTGRRRAATAAVLGALAMLAKPTMVVLPAVCAALWLVEEIRGDGEFDAKRLFARALHFLRSPAGIATAFLCAAALAVLWANLAGPFRKNPGIPLTERMLCLPVVLGGWCARFALLAPIRHFYYWPSPADLPLAAVKGVVACSVAFIAALLAARTTRFDKAYLFGILLAAISFFPPLLHSGLTKDFITADRYGYFPLIGIFIAVAVLAERLEGNWKTAFLTLLAVWMFAGIAKSRPILHSWSGDVALWEFDVKSDPSDVEANYFLGLAYQRQKKYPEALKCYAKCLETDPEYQKALYNSGSVMFELGRYEEAEALYSKAVEVGGKFKAQALASLAEALIRQRKVDPAIEKLEEALSIDQGMGEARLRLARLLLFKGDRKKALEQASIAAGQGVEWTEDLKNAFPNRKDENGK